MNAPHDSEPPLPAEQDQPSSQWHSGFLRGALICGGLLTLGLAGILLDRCGRIAVLWDPAAIPPEIASRLAGTRAEAAQAKLGQGRPGEALALLATALAADPAARDARSLAEEILRGSTWHFPVLEMKFPLRVEHVASSRAPENLWFGLAGETSTVVRWNRSRMAIESVLFPIKDSTIRSLVVDQTGARTIIERGGFLLLCDGQTLKPVMDMGVLPEFVTPASVVVFSQDGLLVAHPAVLENGALAWRIRDAVSGQVLRSHEVRAPDGSPLPRPLTAFLDRAGLRVLHADGGLLKIPVSPVEDVSFQAADEELHLLHAHYLSSGSSWLGLFDQGPHAPQLLSLHPSGGAGELTAALIETSARHPWNRHPGIWSGLLRDSPFSPLWVENDAVTAQDGLHVPIRASAGVTAVARHGAMIMVGAADGTLTAYQLLPKPVDIVAEPDHPTEAADADAIAAWLNLTTALCGLRHREDGQGYQVLSSAERLQSAEACDAVKLRQLFPSLDFQPVVAALQAITLHDARPQDIEPLKARLIRADPEGQGSPAVAALAKALESSKPGGILECLAAVENPPPLIRKLAESRAAWLQGRKADAFSGWPDEFPSLQKIRLREDWDGWEQTDFGPALEAFRRQMDSELGLLSLPGNSTPEQRKDLFERLTDPETARTFGKRRIGRAALQAAQAFLEFPDAAESAFTLAVLAGNFAAEPAAAIRVEARALAALGLHDKAHERWLALITEQPLPSHQSSDYSEAAYTAFETANPQQAMEILKTGIQRFPDDPEFTLRAGWIALLTGHAEHAYRFLLNGRNVGFPPGTDERAATLLAIAAAQCGEAFEAGEFFEELIKLNPAWEDPATIEDLDWPDELKATLRQLAW